MNEEDNEETGTMLQWGLSTRHHTIHMWVNPKRPAAGGGGSSGHSANPEQFDLMICGGPPSYESIVHRDTLLPRQARELVQGRIQGLDFYPGRWILSSKIHASHHIFSGILHIHGGLQGD